MQISVVIPTYNRSKRLAVTIDSFICQNFPKDQYEIIISNNNSTDNTKEVINEFLSRNLTVRIVCHFERRQGVHYARNSAAKIAKGQILYFTDDDMIADADLLKEIVRPFAYDKSIACVTGKVVPKWETNPPAWVLGLGSTGLLSLHDERADLIISSYDCGCFSCHQAIRKDAFFETGGFNPENTAGEWLGDGETGLNIKIEELGYKFAYTGRSITYHRIPQKRMTQLYLNRRLANQGNCDSYTEYRKHRYSKEKLCKQICYHFVSLLLTNPLKLVLKFIISDKYWRLHVSYCSYYVNRIKYDYKLIKDEKWRDLVLRRDWLNE